MTPITTVPRVDSAKILLRLPRGLHSQIKQIAAEQGVSVNTLLATLVAGGIGWKLDRQ